jgi:hypothetical protein
MSGIIDVQKYGDGWYCFKDVPQEANYIKVHFLRCGTDRKALNQAKRINSNFSYIIKEPVSC